MLCKKHNKIWIVLINFISYVEVGTQKIKNYIQWFIKYLKRIIT